MWESGGERARVRAWCPAWAGKAGEREPHLAINVQICGAYVVEEAGAVRRLAVRQVPMANREAGVLRTEERGHKVEQ